MPATAIRHPTARAAMRGPSALGWALGVSLLGALAAMAHAQPVQRAGDYLSRMDSDRSGRVSLPEFQAWMGYAFERMDRDGDGWLRGAELPGSRGAPISLAAHCEALAATFRRQDRNGDGQLDARELAAPPR